MYTNATVNAEVTEMFNACYYKLLVDVANCFAKRPNPRRGEIVFTGKHVYIEIVQTAMKSSRSGRRAKGTIRKGASGRSLVYIMKWPDYLEPCDGIFRVRITIKVEKHKRITAIEIRDLINRV